MGVLQHVHLPSPHSNQAHKNQVRHNELLHRTSRRNLHVRWLVVPHYQKFDWYYACLSVNVKLHFYVDDRRYGYDYCYGWS